jgi:peptidoglycan/LPS O-acetylase OafA/YrhL
MWGHLRALFFVDFTHLQNPSPFTKAIYFITGFGHQAVMVFFVLSGFLISTSVVTKFAAKRWSARDYGIDRLSRLYVVLIPGLLLGAVWDGTGQSLFRWTGLYSQPLPAFGTLITQNQISLKILIGNLFFLQTILCPTFGSNQPLWSLANEFWYYVLFPLGLIAAVAWRKLSLRLAIPVTILTLGIASFVGWNILSGLFIWLAGFGLVFAYRWLRLRRKVASASCFAVSLAGLSLCLFAARTGKLGTLGSDAVIGLMFAFFLFGVLQMEWRSEHKHYANIARFFSDFSYSLYVLHFPFLLFLRGWIALYARWQPDALHLFYGFLIGVLVIGYAWAISQVTENKTREAREWLKGAVGRHVSAFVLVQNDR